MWRSPTRSISSGAEPSHTSAQDHGERHAENAQSTPSGGAGTIGRVLSNLDLFLAVSMTHLAFSNTNSLDAFSTTWQWPRDKDITEKPYFHDEGITDKPNIRITASYHTSVTIIAVITREAQQNCGKKTKHFNVGDRGELRQTVEQLLYSVEDQ